MCVEWSSPWKRNEYPFVAYKAVTVDDVGFCSILPLYKRVGQGTLDRGQWRGTGNKGSIRRFVCGQLALADHGSPGFYLHESYSKAEQDAEFWMNFSVAAVAAVLEVLVPTGAKIRFAEEGMLTADIIRPLAECTTLFRR